MLKINETHYSQFTAQERVNLTIAALSRHDHEEARRLYKTCPKYRYLATDYEFTRRLEAITWVGEKYVELCQNFYDKVLLSQAVISATILNDNKLLEGKLPYSLNDMEEAKTDHISSLKSIHQAFIEFCEEVGIDSNQLLQWLCPPGGREGIDKYLAMDLIEPDKGFTLFIKKKFCDHWEGHSNIR